MYTYSITCGRFTGLSFICFYEMFENVNMMSCQVGFQIERFSCQLGSTNISSFFNLTEKLIFDVLKMAENFYFYLLPS